MKKALRVTTEGTTEVLDLSENTLNVLQKAVDGYVQCVDFYRSNDNPVTMWLNEEGKLFGKPHNPYAQRVWDKEFGTGTDYIVGDVVFSGLPDDEGDTMGLTDEALQILLAVVNG